MKNLSNFDLWINIKHALTNAIAGAIYGGLLATSLGLPILWGAGALGLYGLLGGSLNDIVSFIRNNKSTKDE